MSSYDEYVATQLRAIANLVEAGPSSDSATNEIKEASCVALADILRRYLHKGFEDRVYEKLSEWGGLKAYLKTKSKSKMRNDIDILLSNIEHMLKEDDANLDPEDKALIAQIKTDYT